MYIREKQRKLKYKLQKYEQIIKEYKKKPQVEKETITNKLDHTDVIIKLKRMLNSPVGITKLSDDDWHNLSVVVNTMHAGFDEKLQDLCKMSEQDYRLCLLLKVGVNPTDISKLLYKSKTGISSIRRKLYSRAFGKKGESAAWDEVIASL